MDVPLSWQLAKLLLSIGLVLGLSSIAVRVSARVAGLLAGYPLGTSIALLFIGLEISPEFATQSAVHTLAGFTATLALGAGYLACGRRDGLGGILRGCLGGFGAWLAVSLVLTQLDFTRVTGTLTTLAAIVMVTWLYRQIPDNRTPPPGRFSWAVMALRAALAALIIVVITGLAHWVPAAWAGVMAAFPVTLFPFLIMLHLAHGAAPVATVIKHFPAGLGSLLSYTLCVSLTYATLGLAWGTLIGFVMATLWLLGWSQWLAWRRTQRLNREARA